MSDTPGWLIDSMTKHLPPSGATLRLLDIGGAAGEHLTARRGDLDITAIQVIDAASIADDSMDAIAVVGVLSPSLLSAALRILRPGGRLIAVDAEGQPDAAHVQTLEGAGYVRILVERPAESPDGSGVLLRGEKAHTSADTLARIRVASARDDVLTDLSSYPGRYLYLLIRQSPNKPVWALRDGEILTWQAVMLDLPSGAMLLAFSSLAKAVAFMQPAILAGRIRDVNKVGKFSRETAQGWETSLLLNPSDEILARYTQSLLPIDPATAESPDE
ncbi:MAG: hypothetical protein SF123_00850 [Chloroflexota bacterium]|nr:hypothetical protein [Chloroflexota bacterium]